MEHKPHISKKKERVIEDLVTLMKEYPVIGILDMSNLPALQFQRIKFKLKDKLEFRLVKKRLMKIAFDKSDKKDISKLKDRLEGIPALIFTKEDPFKVAKAIKKEVSAAPARPGQIAPEDIVLPAGPTPFTPGPMIGELGAMGIKSEVKNGKISVREDKVLVNKGEEINAKIADLLSKLGVEPMKIGFNLLLTYRDGEILEKDVLFVDEKLYLETLAQFARDSEGLAIHIGYICKETVKKMLGKAESEAKALSDTVKLEEKMEIKEEVKVEEPKEEIKEEPQQEVVKEEPEPIEEVKEEPKEEPKQEPVEQPEEKPVEEIKEEPEKIEETPKEEPKEEPVEEKKEVEKLKDVKEETTVGMRPGKDVTKEDIDLAAKQLQQIQDNLIKGGK